MRPLLSLTLAALASVLLLANTTRAENGPKNDGPPQPPPTKKSGIYPFRGTITEVDTEKKTITLRGKARRVVHITAQTKIQKDGKPGSFEDARVGEEVGGRLQRTEDGTLQGLSLRIGPKPETDQKPKRKKDSRLGE